MVSMKNALLSVTDKTGLTTLASQLTALGWTLYATSGTRRGLEGVTGVECRSVEALTGFPEMMDGRVKTLNPKIFAGILARRDHAGDKEALEKFQIVSFDLVVVNLYAFGEHLGKPVDDQAAFIDIGGPSLIRAAAKNCASVCVVTDPADYGEIIEELKTRSQTSLTVRRRMAAKGFALTAAYDGMIATEWNVGDFTDSRPPARPPDGAPQKLRYGENPHQQAWFAGTETSTWRLLQGKELSYNNLLDADSAFRLASDFSGPAVVIVKHTNPCGGASSEDLLSILFERALSGDPQSAFGGIVGVNRTVDGAVATEACKIFLELVVAPGFSDEARVIFGAKKNLRLVEWPKPAWAECDVRSAMGGLLTQTADTALGWDQLKTVTRLTVKKPVLEDLQFAWTVAKHAKSNAIVIARNRTVLGVGAGQMSRVDSVEQALKKAGVSALAGAGPKGLEGEGLTGAGPKILQGAVLASDAFFPFRDNIDRLKGLGVVAIVSPGGSLRDTEVIEACNEHEIAMIFTGVRHFRH